MSGIGLLARMAGKGLSRSRLAAMASVSRGGASRAPQRWTPDIARVAQSGGGAAHGALALAPMAAAPFPIAALLRRREEQGQIEALEAIVGRGRADLDAWRRGELAPLADPMFDPAMFDAPFAFDAEIAGHDAPAKAPAYADAELMRKRKKDMR